MSTSINQATDALLVIDVQNDFCPPQPQPQLQTVPGAPSTLGGALAVTDGDAVVPIINCLAQRFSHVILTQDWHPAGHISFASSHGAEPFTTIEAPYGPQALWPDHCIQGTPGADLHPSLRIPHAELILRKGFRKDIDSYSAFLENDHRTPTGLSGYLRERGIRRLFLCGLAYDFCVRFSALDGTTAGFECIVLEDATRAVGLDGSVHETKAAFASRNIVELRANTL